MARKLTQPPEQPRSDPVVAAIERVLKAEREGVEVLRQSEDEAKRLLADARAQAGDIARRTDKLITKIHAVYLQKIKAEFQQFATANPESRDDVYNPATLNAAVDRVAAKLTGGQ